MKPFIYGGLLATAFALPLSAQAVDCTLPANAENAVCLAGTAEDVSNFVPLLAPIASVAGIAGLAANGGGTTTSTPSTPGS